MYHDLLSDAVLENLELELEEKGEPGQQLSAWELYVLNDLIFQIATKKCPMLSRPVASFLKDFITESVKSAPEIQTQNPHFQSSYSKLMDCFDHVDWASKSPGKKLESAQFVKSDKNEEKLEIEFNTLNDHLTNFFRFKRESDDLAEDVHIENISQARNKFSELLHDIYRVVQLSCPAEFKLQNEFSRTVITELMFWVSQDVHSLTATSLKYFKLKNSILNQIDECLQTL